MRYLNVTKESIEKEHYLPVAIDPGKKICGVVIMHPEAHNHSIIKSLEIENCSLKDAEALTREAEEAADKFACKPIFIFEATSILWRPLFAYLETSGYPCHTVSASQTNSSRKTKMRKTQTDEIDATQIAKLYKQGNSHPTKLPSEPLMSMRELTRLYSFLLDIRGNIYNRMKTLSFQLFPELESCFSDLFIKTTKVLMKKELVNPEVLSKTRLDKLANILKKASHGRFKLSKAKELKEKATSSFGMKKGAPGFSYGLSLLVLLANSIDSLLEPLKEKITSLLTTVPQKLTTFPGLDTIGAATFISELGDPAHFSNKDQVITWFGLDVVWRISAGRGKGWHISKAGTPYGRRWLYLTAGEFVRFFPPAKAKYLRLRKTCTHKKALSAIAADCAEILFAMYRDNSCFNPGLYR